MVGHKNARVLLLAVRVGRLRPTSPKHNAIPTSRQRFEGVFNGSGWLVRGLPAGLIEGDSDRFKNDRTGRFEHIQNEFKALVGTSVRVRNIARPRGGQELAQESNMPGIPSRNGMDFAKVISVHRNHQVAFPHHPIG